MKERLSEMLARAGVALNGNAPTDIQVHDERLYSRIFRGGGSVAVGESYMDGWWDCEDLAGFFFKLLRSDVEGSVKRIGLVRHILPALIFNMQNRSRARRVGEDVYDIGNDLYEAMLGPSMAYTCGYWKNASNLDEAQEAKFDLVCRKLGLKPGDRILDIGCGWGNFLAYAAKKYGISGVGITISKEQMDLAREIVQGLDVEIRFEDYRDMTGQFDHVVAIGMFEHVGPKNYRTYFKKVRELVKDDGLVLLHTIGSRRTTYIADPWFNKYIFPNGVMPSVERLGKATDGLFVLEDWHNFGADYDQTLMAWYANFERKWPTLKSKYGERFFRMWRYYLLSMAGGFRSRRTQLWQVVLSKQGVIGGYNSIR
jgi:cyclopropane-fatty-acyl-phospholipid synthase